MNSNYDLIELSSTECREWDEFLKLKRNATIFHTIGWKSVLEETFHYDSEYHLVIDAKGRIIGISPSFNVQTLFGKVLISQPFFEYGGPIIEEANKEAYAIILKHYCDEAKSKKLKFIEIKMLDDIGIEYIFKSQGFSKLAKANNFYINLKGKDFERDIWFGLYTKKSRIRNSVLKAISSGVKIKEYNDINIYYRLYLKTMERLGSPPYPKMLFKNIEKYIGQYARFTYALLDDWPIAAMMSFLFNKRDLMVGLVSDDAYQKYRPNDLLYNEQIEYATNNGFDVVDFGRTRPNSQHERYKQKWGAIKCELYSYVFPRRTNEDINPYRFYLLLSGITRKFPWVLTRTGIGECIIKKFP
jgi:lipid II:glycine glycyltransferase (peptidoglycan interpeptide bridge formation enzyme)